MRHNILKLLFFGVVFSIKSITFSNAQNNLIALSVQENIIDISNQKKFSETANFEYRLPPSNKIRKGFFGHFLSDYQKATLKRDNNLCSVSIPKYLYNVNIVNPKIAKKEYKDAYALSQVQDISALIRRTNSDFLERTRKESRKVYKKLKRLKPNKDCALIERRLAAIQKGSIRKLNKKMRKLGNKRRREIKSILGLIKNSGSTSRLNKANTNISSFPARKKTKSARPKIGPAAVQKRIVKQDARRRAARQKSIRNLNKQINRIRSKKF